MKKFKILSIIMLVVIAFACDDDYEPPFSFSDAVWKVSETPTETQFVIGQDDYISFVDLSQGVLSHEWTIDEGCVFLRPDFTKNDSVYTEFIIPDAGKTSDEARTHVLFQESGLKNIRLYNTYPDSVTFITEAEDTIPAVKQGDIWVIDTTFVVDVYAHIEPAFKVYFGETLLKEISATDIPDTANVAAWDTVTVEVGQELTFVDMTTIGRPTKRDWNIVGGVPSTSNDSVSNVAFFKMGVASGSSIVVSRTGNGVPKGTYSKWIPLIVKVIQSSQPFEFSGKAKELGEKKIGFNVSGEVADFFGEEDNFTVHVKNDAASFEQDIKVSGVKVSSSDATLIELTLSETIYNTDSVWISYSGGSITSLDERELQVFINQLVVMEIGGSVTNSDICGFETLASNDKKAYADGWWVGAGNIWYARTEDLAANGKASMKYTSAGGVTNKKLTANEFVANGAVAPAGPYIEKIKVYVPEGTTMTAFKTFIGTPAHTSIWDLTGIKKDQWVTLSKNIVFAEQPTAKYGININVADNPGVTGDQEIYFDTMELIPLEARPTP